MSPSALKKMGNAAERINDQHSASIYYQAYLDKKPNDYNTAYKLAEIYKVIGDFPAAEELYKAVWKNKEKKYPLAQLYYAEMLKVNGKCEEAIPNYLAFRKSYLGKKDARIYRRIAKDRVESCESFDIKKTLSQQGEVRITLLPKPFNSDHIEASPIYLSEDVLLYNSLKTNGKTIFSIDETLPQRNFYVATEKSAEWIDEGIWKEVPKVKGKEIGNGAFNYDKSRFYFSACVENARGKMDCDLYRIDRRGNAWSQPINLGSEVNTKNTETQPAVGIDEAGREVVYFVSDREGGRGGLDIWYTIYNEKRNVYRKPKNCGSKINTSSDEMTPFIHTADGTFYFSSDGHPGFGQLDVFSTSGQKNRWDVVQNLGAEINSSADELYYMRAKDKDKGYFVSNRKTEGKLKLCCDDLYFFEEIGKLKLFAEGNLKSIDEDGNKEALGNAKLILYQLAEDGEKIYQNSQMSEEDGTYKISLKPDKQYILRVEKDGYLTEGIEFNTLNANENTNIVQNIELNTIEERIFQLKGILFEYNSDKLVAVSYDIINRGVLEILKSNPTVIVEILAHTDSIGSKAYNQNLSQRRAQSVVSYLIKQGIDKNRLKAKGYGYSMPVAPNSMPDGSDNPEGRAKNRRVEFRVIGKVLLKDDWD